MRFRLPSLFVASLLAACESSDSTDSDSKAATSDPSNPVAPSGTPAETNQPNPPATPNENEPAPDGVGGSADPPDTPEPNPVVPPAPNGGMGGEPDTVSPDIVSPNVEPPVGGTANAGSGGTPSPSPGGGEGGTAGAQPTGGGGNGGGGAPPAPGGTPIVIVGGFDYASSSYPLRTFDLDKATGALMQRGDDVDVGPNPAYLALAPSGDFLYVANETDDDAGGLSSVQIAADGALTFVNHQTGSDGGFAHVAVDPNGRFAFGASYNGGSVSVFPIESDGSLGNEIENRDFGDGAQSHYVGFDASGQFVFVPNKGNDAVAQLLLGEDGALTDNTPPEVASPQGAGPRHFALHPSGAFAFVLNELGSSMTPFQLADDGTLTAGTTVSTLPTDFNGQNSGAHVEVSPDGRFVYGSNRGHDSIAVFAVDETSGALTLVEHEPTLGSTPRDFEMDPNGDVLIVANQDTTSLTVFAIAGDGRLSPLGGPQDGPPSPAAVQFVYLAE